jgi:hypothetical protein
VTPKGQPTKRLSPAAFPTGAELLHPAPIPSKAWIIIIATGFTARQPNHRSFAFTISPEWLAGTEGTYCPV